MNCNHEKATLQNFGRAMICEECNHWRHYGYSLEASLNYGANVYGPYGEWKSLESERPWAGYRHSGRIDPIYA